MSRVLFFVLLAVVIWLLYRGVTRRGAERELPAARSATGEDMVSCARCGVNLPRSEAAQDGARYVCRDNPRCVPAPGSASR
jgi:uncharacterized protein